MLLLRGILLPDLRKRTFRENRKSGVGDMKAVFNNIPNFCPGCGCELFLKDNDSRAYYFSGSPYLCDCGTRYKYVSSEDELKQCNSCMNYFRLKTMEKTFDKNTEVNLVCRKCYKDMNINKMHGNIIWEGMSEQKDFTEKQLAGIKNLEKAFQLCAEVELIAYGQYDAIFVSRADNYFHTKKRNNPFKGKEELIFKCLDEKCYEYSGTGYTIYYK